MTLPFDFHPQAEAELEQAVEYLEEEQTGAGQGLLQIVESALDHVSAYPESCPVARGTVRAKVVSRYRYTIYYRPKADHIRILAVAHQSRAPYYWLGRS